MSHRSARMLEGGRMIVPAEFRRVMGVAAGDTLMLEMDGEDLRVRSYRAAIRAVQEDARKYGRQDISLTDELIAERRREEARDSKRAE